MLRSLSRLPLSKAATFEARTRAKIGHVRGHLSRDQWDIIRRRREHLRREIEREERKRVGQLAAHLAAPSRERTREIVERIIYDKSTYQEFRGQIADVKEGNGRKRIRDTVSIRRDAVDDDIDADVNPKRQRRLPVIHRDTMDWVSILFPSFSRTSLTSIVILKDTMIDDRMGELIFDLIYAIG